MEAIETIHISAKDLICPVCYQKYGLQSFQPISLNCGHNICSHCLRKVRMCPMCRSKILDRSSYSKNVLISCILEQKNRVKECQIHNRPIEFFCKDHKQLLCVDCGIDGKHFSHNFVKCKEVDTQAEKIRVLMKKIDTKEEESRNKFKTFLEKEKRSLKRKIDEILDEYIEPIMAVKKKLRREVDAFILNQNGNYEKETIREMMLKWKKDNESLVEKWEATGEGEIAAQIVSNETEDIEKRIMKYDNRTEKLETETGEKIDFMLKDIKSRVGVFKGQWKKVKKRFSDVLNANKLEIDPILERQYLAEYLEERGILVAWTGTEGEETLEIKPSGKPKLLKDLEDKYFECTLEKLKLVCLKLDQVNFEIVCKALEKIMGLLDLKVTLQNVSDQEVLTFSESIRKIKTLQKLNVLIISERVSERSFRHLWVAISTLHQLKTLNLTLEDCNELAHNEAELLTTMGRMKTLRELTIQLTDCDAISNENFGDFLQSLKGLTHLVKFGLNVSECKKLSYKLFDSLSKTLALLNRLEELNLSFEGFYELSNPTATMSLANTISNLKGLKKLEVSFADNLCLPSYVVRKFLGKVTQQLTHLKEFSLDLSRCREIVNQTLESIGASAAQLQNLSKLTLKLRMCTISEKGIAALATHLSKLNSLKSLYLDCRNCKLMEENAHKKALEYFSKIEQKEFLFEEPKQEQIQGRDNQNNILEDYDQDIMRNRLWSPADGSISFDESEILDFEEDYLEDDYEEDEDDFEDLNEDYDDQEYGLSNENTSETSSYEGN